MFYEAYFILILHFILLKAENFYNEKKLASFAQCRPD
jgi:hypothetical protein